MVVDAIVEEASDFNPYFEEWVFEVGEWTVNDWQTEDCLVGTETEHIHLYNGESRAAFSTLSTNRHYRVVNVKTERGTCTGVLVGPHDVLTNAHCVTYNANPSTAIPVEYICSRGNFYSGADCVTRSTQTTQGAEFWVTVGPKWAAGGTNPSNDFALIEWNDGPGDPGTLTGVPTSGMPLSAMTDVDIESARVGLYGHPALTWPNDQCTSETRLPKDTLGGW